MNILDFNGTAADNLNPSTNDKVLAYIGDTGSPCYIPISQIQLLGTRDVIYDNITPTGTTAATTTTYLNYGINVIDTASITAYAMRLPYPPIKGKTLTVVNTSGYPIVIYPSVDGGSINGVVNGSASVPSDGKSYVFTCWENPLPGAWSWTPPATNQYDSGDITFTQSTSAGIASLYATNIVDYNADTDGSNSIALAGTFRPLLYQRTTSYKGYWFKPSTYWNSVRRIKIYTNTFKSIDFYLDQSYAINYYNPTTGQYVAASISSGSGTLINGGLGSFVSGTFVPSAGQSFISNFVGDAGTIYGILDNSSSVISNSTVVGDKYLGQTTYNGNTVDVWATGYIRLTILPNSLADISGLKIRFFIEYN